MQLHDRSAAQKFKKKEEQIIIKRTVMLLHVICYSEAPHVFKFTNVALVQHAEKYDEILL